MSHSQSPSLPFPCIIPLPLTSLALSFLFLPIRPAYI
jgi:hypothetical protein